jgi:hypothetical protein
MKLLRIDNVDFDVADQQLIMYSAFVRHWRKMEIKWDNTSATTASYSLVSEVWYDNLAEFGIFVQPANLIIL